VNVVRERNKKKMLGDVEEPFAVDLVVDLLLIIASISTAPIATLQPTKMRGLNKDTVQH